MTAFGISGASGQLGRLAAELLLERVPAEDVVLATRTPSDLATFAELGATVRFADFDQPESLPAAYEGIDRLFMVSASNATGKREDQHGTAIAAARKAGVKKLVFPSMPKVEDPNHPVGLTAEEYRLAEGDVQASGLDWTIMRNGPYSELHIIERLPELFGSGQVVTNAGEGRVPFISRRDCADAAIAVLVGEGHSGRVYDVSGPESLTWADVAGLLTEVSGRPVEYVPVSDGELRDRLAAAGAPALFIDAMTGMGVAIREGYFDVQTDTVQELTGHAPVSLKHVLEEHRSELTNAVGS